MESTFYDLVMASRRWLVASTPSARELPAKSKNYGHRRASLSYVSTKRICSGNVTEESQNSVGMDVDSTAWQAFWQAVKGEDRMGNPLPQAG